MRVRKTSTLALLPLMLIARPAAAQERQMATLTLEEAIDLARQNNPVYRQTANDESLADWQAREAYAAFLPSVTGFNTFGYTARGEQRLGNLGEFSLGRTPVTYTSNYGLFVGLQVSGQTFFNIAQQRANQRAIEASVDAAEYTLLSTVTQVYLDALSARDGVVIAQSALESADEAFKLAEARASVGAATRLDVTTAQVDHGRAEVALIQAENLYATDRLRLLQTIGIDIGREVELTSQFVVFEPQWEVEELTDAALRGHPGVISARKAEAAANHATRGAWTSYLPSLSLNGGWSGFVRKTADDSFLINSARSNSIDAIADCEFWNTLSSGLSSQLPGRPVDCSARHTLTPADEASILASNDRFPFDYTPTPASFSLQVSVPIFNRFQRERQVQTARVAADDAKYQRRAEELARSTEVATALLTLKTAYRTVQIEERNAAAAAEQLEIARERYRLGAGCGPAAGGGGQQTGLCTTFLELTRAQETKVRADQAHLAATYTFHVTLATLEAAVGRPLR